MSSPALAQTVMLAMQFCDALPIPKKPAKIFLGEALSSGRQVGVSVAAQFCPFTLPRLVAEAAHKNARTALRGNSAPRVAPIQQPFSAATSRTGAAT